MYAAVVVCARRDSFMGFTTSQLSGKAERVNDSKGQQSETKASRSGAPRRLEGRAAALDLLARGVWYLASASRFSFLFACGCVLPCVLVVVGWPPWPHAHAKAANEMPPPLVI